MLSAENIPARWKEVLSTVQSVFPDAAIGGGALRDLVYGKPVKDVDIFTRCRSYYPNHEELVLKLFPNAVVTHAMSYGDKPSNEFHRIIWAIYDLNIPGEDFQLIVGEYQSGNPDTFDLSITQIVYDGNEIKFTDAFVETKETGKINFMNKQSYARRIKRYDRITEKYPEMHIDKPMPELLPCQ